MIQLPLNAAPLDPAKGSLNNSRGRQVCCEHVGPTWDNERSGASATWGEGGVGMKTGRIKRWIVSRRRPIPEPRYAIVVCRGGSVEAELLMGDISATRAQLGVSMGVIFSSLDDAHGHLRDNGLPTRGNPLDDGTVCAIRDTQTGELVDASGNQAAGR